MAWGSQRFKQCIHYKNQLSEVVVSDTADEMVLNNLLRQKLMPRFSFDGTKKPKGRSEDNCTSVVELFHQDVVERLPDFKMFSASSELGELIKRAHGNHDIFNYWA